MNGIIGLDLTKALVGAEELAACEGELKAGQEKLLSGSEEFTGWVRLPLEYDRAEIQRIKDTAKDIREKCQVFIVVGIGGSYLGSKAVISALRPSFSYTSGCDDNGPEIYFAGHNISGTYHAELLDKIKDKELCLCVISKSGTTTEPGIAFAVLKDVLYRKYGKEEACRRIYAVTDASKGILHQEAEEAGYTSFVVPDDIGGRYSVLSPVGLLPIAVADIDIQRLLDGAGAIAQIPGNIEENPAWAYAAVRLILQNRGKRIEIFEAYEPTLKYFSEWLKQLFGESEGKDGKGLFPSSLQFSTDLHSMGQYLQDGSQIFFETIFNIEHPSRDILVPDSAGSLLGGKSMNEINKAAMLGVMAAHQSAGIPMVKIDIPELSPFYFGQLIYFFEMACALGGYLLGVNPFDQPGVENYKAEVRKILEELINRH